MDYPDWLLPSPTSCLHPLLAFWLFTIPLHLLLRDPKGETKGKKTQMTLLCYWLVLIKSSNNWPKRGISGGPFFSCSLKSLSRRGWTLCLYIQTSWWTWEMRENVKQARAGRGLQDPICKARKRSKCYWGDLQSTGSRPRNHLVSNGNKKHTRTRWRYCSGYYQGLIVTAHIPEALMYAPDIVLSALHILTHLIHTPIHTPKQKQNLMR